MRLLFRNVIEVQNRNRFNVKLNFVAVFLFLKKEVNDEHRVFEEHIFKGNSGL